MDSSISPLRLMLVDDDDLVLSGLERLFLNDFLIIKAKNIKQALQRLDPNDPPAIALIDYQLPDGSGLEILSQLQEKAPTCVRTLLSGILNLEELIAGVNASLIHRIFRKPWDNQDLRVQILECRQLHFLLQEKTKLAQLSITDSVTGLTNHRYFHNNLKREVERARRHQRPLTLLMADLDGFKQLNDAQGHPEGDRILQMVGQAFIKNLRSMDTVSRYGGDEFALILPDTGLDEGREVADRLRQLIEQSFGDVGVTASIGIAAIPPYDRDILEAADQALYTAKKKGRNRIALATD